MPDLSFRIWFFKTEIIQSWECAKSGFKNSFPFISVKSSVISPAHFLSLENVQSERNDHMNRVKKIDEKIFYPDWLELKTRQNCHGHGHGQVFRVFLMETIYGNDIQKKNQRDRDIFQFQNWYWQCATSFTEINHNSLN